MKARHTHKPKGEEAKANPEVTKAEPRWPALLAIFTTGLINAALPHHLLLGPSWLLIALVVGLETPAIILHRRKYHRFSQALGFVVSFIMTAFMIGSLALLVTRLIARTEQPLEMLRAASLLWISNVLIFALWYWRLDGGGPAQRDRLPGHTEGAFLFPQMSWEVTRGKWSPQFVDYLFLSFNTSTALSPTDVPVLSRWAKILCMLQALMSLMVVILLAARAINTL